MQLAKKRTLMEQGTGEKLSSETVPLDWYRLPNKTASVLAGLRSSPFSRNQRKASSQSKTALHMSLALDRTTVDRQHSTYCGGAATGVREEQ